MILRPAVAFGIALAALLAAGCSPGDIQLNGKVFDAIGATSALGGQTGTPKLAARQPLILPPSMDKLPQPGSGQVPSGDLASINDPDRAQKSNQAELERQQKAYCDANYEPMRQRGDASADAVKGPAGPCRASAFTALTNWNLLSSKGDADSEDGQ